MKLNVGNKQLKRGMNILSVEVPAELRVRHSSGINWIDDALGGKGFTPSTSMMLTGGPGCGKTTMTLQLADALTGSGHIALYNSGEESHLQIKMVAERLKLKNGFVIGQDEKVQDVIDHANWLRSKNPTKQVFILQDSLQTLDDGKYKDGTVNSNTPLRCTEILTEWAKTRVEGMFGIVLFIGQVNKDGDFSGKNAIRHAADAHAHLYFDTDKRSETYGERLFEVTKNRFGSNGKTYVVGLESDGLFEKGSFSKAGNLGVYRSE